MKSISRRALMLVVPLLLIGSVARAEPVVQAKVPFPFMVQNRVFPAGEYRLERDDLNPAVLIIRGERGTHASGIVTTIGASGEDPKGDKAALVFTRHETMYRLKDVWESRTQGQEIVQR